jgi:hypothetical protein
MEHLIDLFYCFSCSLRSLKSRGHWQTIADRSSSSEDMRSDRPTCGNSEVPLGLGPLEKDEGNRPWELCSHRICHSPCLECQNAVTCSILFRCLPLSVLSVYLLSVCRMSPLSDKGIKKLSTNHIEDSGYCRGHAVPDQVDQLRPSAVLCSSKAGNTPARASNSTVGVAVLSG